MAECQVADCHRRLSEDPEWCRLQIHLNQSRLVPSGLKKYQAVSKSKKRSQKVPSGLKNYQAVSSSKAICIGRSPDLLATAAKARLGRCHRRSASETRLGQGVPVVETSLETISLRTSSLRRPVHHAAVMRPFLQGGRLIKLSVTFSLICAKEKWETFDNKLLQILSGAAFSPSDLTCERF